MKIVFLCGSLESGRDGVGDYTRRLASEVLRQNHEARIIALNDKSIKELVIEKQNDKGIKISVLRIPKSTSSKQRYSLAKEWIESFNPEWLSLQYVPFSFHEKGLPLNLIKNLRYLSKNRRWHIMFHELWIGKEGLKKSVVSILQKSIIKHSLKLLRPLIIHTHLPIYYDELKKISSRVNKLPLFSSISKFPHSIKQNNDVFKVAFFSQASCENSVLTFLSKLNFELVQNKKKLEILFIGEKRDSMQKLEEMLKKNINFQIPVKYTGFLKEEALSQIIQTCDIGMTPTPQHALGKSSSTAAFFAHGVPVAAPVVLKKFSSDREGFFSPVLNASIIRNPDLMQICEAKRYVQEAKEEIRLEKIAAKFIKDIETVYE